MEYQNKNGCVSIDELPDEIIIHITLFLGFEDMSSFFLVNKAVNFALCKEALWYQLFGGLVSLRSEKPKDLTFKTWFLEKGRVPRILFLFSSIPTSKEIIIEGFKEYFFSSDDLPFVLKKGVDYEFHNISRIPIYGIEGSIPSFDIVLNFDVIVIFGGNNLKSVKKKLNLGELVMKILQETNISVVTLLWTNGGCGLGYNIGSPYAEIDPIRSDDDTDIPEKKGFLQVKYNQKHPSFQKKEDPTSYFHDGGVYP